MVDNRGRKIGDGTLIRVGGLNYRVLEDHECVIDGICYKFAGLHVFRGQEYFGNLEEFKKIYGEVEVFL